MSSHGAAGGTSNLCELDPPFLGFPARVGEILQRPPQPSCLERCRSPEALLPSLQRCRRADPQQSPHAFRSCASLDRGHRCASSPGVTPQRFDPKRGQGCRHQVNRVAPVTQASPAGKDGRERSALRRGRQAPFRGGCVAVEAQSGGYGHFRRHLVWLPFRHFRLALAGCRSAHMRLLSRSLRRD